MHSNLRIVINPRVNVALGNYIFAKESATRAGKKLVTLHATRQVTVFAVVNAVVGNH